MPTSNDKPLRRRRRQVPAPAAPPAPPAPPAPLKPPLPPGIAAGVKPGFPLPGGGTIGVPQLDPPPVVPPAAPVPAAPGQTLDEAKAIFKQAKARIEAEKRAKEEEQAQEDIDALDTRPGKARLEAFAAKIAERHADVVAIFKGTPYDPTKNKAFKQFLGDQVAEMAMRYVRIGVVHSHDADAITPDAKEKAMKQNGFAIGEAAKGKANEEKAKDADTGSTTSAPDDDEQDAHDRNFLSSPAVEAAMKMGFDPNSDD